MYDLINNNMYYYVAVIIVVMVIIAYYYLYRSSGATEKGVVGASKHEVDVDKVAYILFYTASDCESCKEAKTLLERVESTVYYMRRNEPNVITTNHYNIDYDDIKGVTISTIPVVAFELGDGRIVQYEGELTDTEINKTALIKAVMDSYPIVD